MRTIEDDAALKILADVIKIPSVNDHELTVAKYLQALLAKYDISAKIYPITGDRANLVAEIGHGQPVLAVSGHMDVVAAGDLAAWDTNPFTLVEKSGQLFGRGVTDMKAGLVALVAAMIIFSSKVALNMAPFACWRQWAKKLVKLAQLPFINKGRCKMQLVY